MEDFMKIGKSLEDSGLSIKVVHHIIEKETKEQTGGFLGMSSGTLGASLVGNMLEGKEVKTSQG